MPAGDRYAQARAVLKALQSDPGVAIRDLGLDLKGTKDQLFKYDPVITAGTSEVIVPASRFLG